MTLSLAASTLEGHLRLTAPILKFAAWLQRPWALTGCTIDHRLNPPGKLRCCFWNNKWNNKGTIKSLYMPYVYVVKEHSKVNRGQQGNNKGWGGAICICVITTPYKMPYIWMTYDRWIIYVSGMGSIQAQYSYNYYLVCFIPRLIECLICLRSVKKH